MGAAGAVLICQSDSQEIVAMQYIIMCLVYAYVCVQCISAPSLTSYRSYCRLTGVLHPFN